MSLANKLYQLLEGERVTVIVGGAVVSGIVAARESDADKPYLILRDATIAGGPSLTTFCCMRDAVQGYGIPPEPAPGREAKVGGLAQGKARREGLR